MKGKPMQMSFCMLERGNPSTLLVQFQCCCKQVNKSPQSVHSLCTQDMARLLSSHKAAVPQMLYNSIVKVSHMFNGKMFFQMTSQDTKCFCFTDSLWNSVFQQFLSFSHGCCKLLAALTVSMWQRAMYKSFQVQFRRKILSDYCKKTKTKLSLIIVRLLPRLFFSLAPPLFFHNVCKTLP